MGYHTMKRYGGLKCMLHGESSSSEKASWFDCMTFWSIIHTMEAIKESVISGSWEKKTGNS